MHLMKHVNLKQMIGGALVVLGIVLVVVGAKSDDHGMKKIKKHVMREKGLAEGATKYLAAGVACVVVGAALVVFYRKRK